MGTLPNRISFLCCPSSFHINEFGPLKGNFADSVENIGIWILTQWICYHLYKLPNNVLNSSKKILGFFYQDSESSWPILLFLLVYLNQSAAFYSFHTACLSISQCLLVEFVKLPLKSPALSLSMERQQEMFTEFTLFSHCNTSWQMC